MAAYSPVSESKPYKSMWKIKNKIIILWKQYLVAGGLTALTIEMVLIDSNVRLFQLTTNHPYKNVIFLTTRVRVCKDLPRALTGFQKFSYRAILDGSPNSDHLVVVEVTHVEVASVNGKDTHKISPKFRNSL
ncbi:hypothetical protein F2Q70_00040572 [Brassica cretica]|uniref:DUF223 domain-containing protein n=2 Tax=Brassica cretica TaxID=69181 RepID=A0A3N6QUT6_BRACR|nr:hypothetical protein F2Q70_00040572 [Brassica cretica]KAF2616558.1 hypothetical protein F2Q68_00041242 [Brassica cretica]KAF3495451.1 hypothetical protein DY000_02055686 [Brassica cretica]